MTVDPTGPSEPPGDDASMREVAWRKPSGRLVVVRRAQIATVATVLALPGGLIPLGLGDGFVALLVVGCLLVLAVVADVLSCRRITSWRFAERQDDLVLRRGVLFDRLTVVPYGRMQFVDVVAGPYERIFGVASVHLHTAAAATDARIPGLSPEDAVRLRDALTSLGEARAAGL